MAILAWIVLGLAAAFIGSKSQAKVWFSALF